MVGSNSVLFARRSCRLKTGTGQLTPGLTHQFCFFWSSSCEVGYPQPWLLKEANLFKYFLINTGDSLYLEVKGTRQNTSSYQ